jgi:hypothetical protein
MTLVFCDFSNEMKVVNINLNANAMRIDATGASGINERMSDPRALHSDH